MNVQADPAAMNGTHSTVSRHGQRADEFHLREGHRRGEIAGHRS